MFFAVFNFILSGGIAVIGFMTLNKVSAPKEVVFASLPLLFALHQFTQGFVWLGMDQIIEPRALHMAEDIFVFYAQGLLQFLIPLALWLIEPSGMRKKLIGVLMIAGGLLMAYTVYGLSIYPTSVTVDNGILNYVNPWTDKAWIGILYVLTTCGSLILSNSIAIRVFGWLNLLALILIHFLVPEGFTSIWCLYAAAISIFLYFYFVERRIVFLQELKKEEKKYGLGVILDKELTILKQRYPHLRKKAFRFFKIGESKTAQDSYRKEL